MTAVHAAPPHRVDLDPDLVRAVGGGHRTGAAGERVAAHHLRVDDALEVVARNWRIAQDELRGELDLVALDHAHATVVVCEVKTRRDAQRFGGAVATLTPRKLAQVRRLTGVFLRSAGLPYHRVRLDLVAIDLGRAPALTHLPGVS